MKNLRLCINIDHIATVRQARRGIYPDPIEGAAICERAGADGITAHLREDRRHIQDDDVERLATTVTTTFNLEMACTDEMLAIAERLRPHQVMFVPERRQEITTEGGLDVFADPNRIRDGINRMKAAGIPTSLFIGPDRATIDRCRELGPTAVELHTGPYVHHLDDPGQLDALITCAAHAASLGLEVHAGHGLDYASAETIAALPEIVELNIGHFLIGEAVFTGLAASIKTMRAAMDRGRAKATAESVA